MWPPALEYVFFPSSPTIQPQLRCADERLQPRTLRLTPRALAPFRVLGAKVFSKPIASKDEKEGWRESLYRVYRSGQQSMRVAVYGYKHDAAVFEYLLKEYSVFPEEAGLLGMPCAGGVQPSMIDTACLDVPKASPRFALCASGPPLRWRSSIGLVLLWRWHWRLK
jgi:hypothetical protein